MKPGDKVWMFCPFSNNAILECKVVEWPDNDAAFTYDIVGFYRQRPYVGLKVDAFPSREALCEFYRNIFE